MLFACINNITILAAIVDDDHHNMQVSVQNFFEGVIKNDLVPLTNWGTRSHNPVALFREMLSWQQTGYVQVSVPNSRAQITVALTVITCCQLNIDPNPPQYPIALLFLFILGCLVLVC